MFALETRIAAEWPLAIWGEIPIVVGVSGGPDSVALLRLIEAIRPRQPELTVVAHFNHGWRGAESDSDELFVEQLAHGLGFDCRVGKSQVSKCSEEVARDERYEFLEQTVSDTGARHLVLGHQADDQAETILFRVLRGTGLEGLRGIPRVRAISPVASIIRPLLGVRRTEVLEYLDEKKQAFRDDRSNADLNFRRNLIRSELLPQIENSINEQAVEALIRLGRLAQGACDVMDGLIDVLIDEMVTVVSQNEVRIKRPERSIEPYLMTALFRRLWQNQEWPQQSLSFEDLAELARILTGASQGRQFPGAIKASLSGSVMVLYRGRS